MGGIGLLHAHVLATFLELPGAKAIEVLFQPHHARKTIGHATSPAIGLHTLALRIGGTVGHQTMEQLIAHLPYSTQEIGVESLHMEPILFHPFAKGESRRALLVPFIVAELQREVALGKTQRISPLPLQQGRFAKIMTLAIIHLYPHPVHGTLARGDGGSAGHPHIGHPRFRQIKILNRTEVNGPIRQAHLFYPLAKRRGSFIRP